MGTTVCKATKAPITAPPPRNPPKKMSSLQKVRMTFSLLKVTCIRNDLECMWQCTVVDARLIVVLVEFLSRKL